MQIRTFDSNAGKLHIASQNDALVAISYSPLDPEYLRPLLSIPSLFIQGKSINDLDYQLTGYFSKQTRSFSVLCKLHGSDFQRKVWQACMNIPYGETQTYADIAKQIKNPKAVRAVGTALSKNPIAIIVPCHRVVRSDEKLGGYAGGSNIKRRLLDIEKDKS